MDKGDSSLKKYSFETKIPGLTSYDNDIDTLEVFRSRTSKCQVVVRLPACSASTSTSTSTI